MKIGLQHIFSTATDFFNFQRFREAVFCSSPLQNQQGVPFTT